ncbi:L,D-transpeptidase family protein [Aridibaculum aurantiacum]|uniref:L,D-transpeptidase family protein n=1 Tax=Aridibaculum aurantiacum TaxID=2810307 RepID=UPI001A95ABCC|nr:L,D-transpeptidase [Aridibaculum aurantiacum]
MKSRLILFVVLATILVTNTSFFAAIYSKSAYYIIVDKSDYELNVYDSEGWLASFPIVLGNDDLGDKLIQGDRKTPEGTFTIIAKRVHNKWCRYMALDYPTAVDVEKFNQRKRMGLIPAHAKIGGDIGIHGTWPREDYAVDRYQNWTLGCISLKNEHVKQLFNIIPVGTKITIKK